MGKVLENEQALLVVHDPRVSAEAVGAAFTTLTLTLTLTLTPSLTPTLALTLARTITLTRLVRPALALGGIQPPLRRRAVGAAVAHPAGAAAARRYPATGAGG